ncbi:MAG: SMC-Scp complex subunit ScpB [Elusimicrobia bacterium]|nr:SMC-Scp complex subunit ScpB [Elusimicrobiota bacterium]
MSQAQTLPLENSELKKALESLLFITDHALSLADLCKITGVKDAPRIQALVDELKLKLDQEGSAVQLLEVADGYQMATRPSYAPFVRKLFAERMTMRLSTAAHETLSIVAYKQPITRAEIEEVRGVEVIAALETLLEKRLIRVVGRKESVGRPLLYGTTPEFLRHFGLKNLEDLPPLETFVAQLAEAEKAPAPEPSQAPGPGEIVDKIENVPEAGADSAPQEKPRNIWREDKTPEDTSSGQ